MKTKIRFYTLRWIACRLDFIDNLMDKTPFRKKIYLALKLREYMYDDDEIGNYVAYLWDRRVRQMKKKNSTKVY